MQDKWKEDLWVARVSKFDEYNARRAEQNRERDEAIYKEYMEGKTTRAICAKFGLSKTTINNVIRKKKPKRLMKRVVSESSKRLNFITSDYMRKMKDSIHPGDIVTVPSKIDMKCGGGSSYSFARTVVLQKYNNFVVTEMGSYVWSDIALIRYNGEKKDVLTGVYS